MHTFNPYTLKAEASRSLNPGAAWSTQWIPSQLYIRLHSETLSQNKNENKFHKFILLQFWKLTYKSKFLEARVKVSSKLIHSGYWSDYKVFLYFLSRALSSIIPNSSFHLHTCFSFGSFSLILISTLWVSHLDSPALLPSQDLQLAHIRRVPFAMEVSTL